MKKSWCFVAAATFVGAVGYGSEARAQCRPFPLADEITVFQESNFSGNCKSLSAGSFFDASSFSPVANKTISSIRVGANVRAALFSGTNLSGKVAMYESGRSHTFSVGGFAGLGTNVNDTVQSIKVLNTGGAKFPALYDGNFPSNGQTAWSDEVNGLAHSSTHWFITGNRKKLFKIPFSTHLSNNFIPPLNSPQPVAIPASLQNEGFDHMGDADVANGFVFVPLEHETKGKRPRIAVFRASDLSFVKAQEMFLQTAANNAAWVALDTFFGDELWVGGGHLPDNALQIYKIDWNGIEDPQAPLFFADGSRLGPSLKNRHGSSLSVETLQGGVFSSDGQFFFMVNSGSGRADGRAIFVHHPDSGVWEGQSGNAYGPFNYEMNNPALDANQEPEGMDFFSTTDAKTPSINGELHVLLLNPDVGIDNVWLKHYRLNP